MSVEGQGQARTVAVEGQGQGLRDALEAVAVGTVAFGGMLAGGVALLALSGGWFPW